MFDIGFTEIILIGIVSLVVIGPERLPAVARTAGQWIGKLQRFVTGVKSDLASELESGDLKKLIGDQREQINELKQMVSSAKKDFETTSREAVQGAKKSLKEMETSVSDIDKEGDDVGQSRQDSAKTAVKPTPLGQSTAANSEPAEARPDATGDDGTAAANSASDGSDGMNRTGTESGS